MMSFGFGSFGMIAFWIILIAVIVLLAKGLRSWSKSENQGKEAPLQILERRYAAGELSQSEFESKKRDLAKS